MIFLLLLIIMLLYAVTILQLVYGFNKVKTYQSVSSVPETFFSIVVPFRNESQQLPNLLESIKHLNYPVDLFEIILIDDFSDDNSARLIYDWRMTNGSFQVTLLENIKISGSPKKDAISRAIPIIKNDWVITTDADCIVKSDWLQTLSNYIKSHDVAMIAGAVTFQNPKSFLQHFQQLDLMALQAATIGSFGLGLGFMCNGANFCYKKSLFVELGGFSGNNKTASGDDVFLLQKAVASFPDKVHFLKSEHNIVVTEAAKSWSALFNQRVRWASKTGSYQSVFGKDLAVIVFLGNGCWVLGVGVLGVGSLVLGDPINLSELLVLLGIKFLIDLVLLWRAALFFGKKSIWFVPISSLLYPIFSVLVAVYSLFGKYEWKGRKY